MSQLGASTNSSQFQRLSESKKKTISLSELSGLARTEGCETPAGITTTIGEADNDSVRVIANEDDDQQSTISR